MKKFQKPAKAPATNRLHSANVREMAETLNLPKPGYKEEKTVVVEVTFDCLTLRASGPTRKEAEANAKSKLDKALFNVTDLPNTKPKYKVLYYKNFLKSGNFWEVAMAASEAEAKIKVSQKM